MHLSRTSKPRRRRVGVVTSLSLALVALIGVGGAVGKPAVQATDLVGALARPQAAHDALPAVRSARLVPDSSRLVGAGADAKHWISEDDRGWLCLTTEFVDAAGTWLVGTSCGPPAGVRDQGLWLLLETAVGSNDALVLPDGYGSPTNVAALRRSGGRFIGPNLVVFAAGNRPTGLVLHGPAGATLQVDLPAAGS